MVWWNDKERGCPLSVDHGIRGLYLMCAVCKHSIAMEWPDVLKTWRQGTHMRDMAASLKCSQCGARKGQIMARAWGPTD